ncbi:MAG: LemA family protein [Verrucomicrobia bacterium]|nr:LemA family protein [Verrucomicrobiota bacterium]
MTHILSLIPLLPFVLIPFVVAFVLVVVVIGAYNGLVSARNQFKNAFSQIDVQLKRRYDLIPNLVETAKGYLKHERNTLEEVVTARNAASSAAARAAANPADAGAMQQLLAAEKTLGAGLGRLLAVAEAYPDLKANQNMMLVMEELTSTENRVGFARQAFNDAVTTYNIKVQSFPTNLIAGMFHFAEAQLWEVEKADERQAVKVAFN